MIDYLLIKGIEKSPSHYDGVEDEISKITNIFNYGAKKVVGEETGARA